MRLSSLKQGRRGFTLVELLISMVLVAIVMLAAMGLASAVSNVFYVQDQTVDAQGSLRFASDFLAGDLQRAGFLATPNARRDPLICPKPSAGIGADNLVALRVLDGGSPPGEIYSPPGEGTDNPNIRPDALWLMGSFDSSTSFPALRVNGDGTIELDPARLSGLLGASPEEQFNGLFRRGRLLRVSSASGPAQLVPIGSAAWNGGNATVTGIGLTTRDNGVGCGIEGVNGEGYEVAVVNIIRYDVRRDPVDEAKSNLVRAEIDANTGAVLRTPEGGDAAVPVLEYVTDFQVWVDADSPTATTPSFTPDGTWGDHNGNVPLATLTSGDLWHKARVAEVLLSARTVREDRNLRHLPRQSETDPLLTFNINGEAKGSARVLTMNTRVELTNIAFRRLN
jgi:prepilin-type N-terminal cleavage/methylation domain-containing protein